MKSFFLFSMLGFGVATGLCLGGASAIAGPACEDFQNMKIAHEKLAELQQNISQNDKPCHFVRQAYHGGLSGLTNTFSNEQLRHDYFAHIEPLHTSCSDEDGRCAFVFPGNKKSSVSLLSWLIPSAEANAVIAIEGVKAACRKGARESVANAESWTGGYVKAHSQDCEQPPGEDSQTGQKDNAQEQSEPNSD